MGIPQKKPAVTTGPVKRPSASQLVDEFGLSADTMSPIERRTAISGYDVRHRIEAMVAGVTAKKIKHVYKGDGAATAPGFMILPRIPATHLFSMRHVRILLGYTAHEISHQLKTDFGLLQALVDDKTRPMRQVKQIKEFWNAIEDYRIEKLVQKEYPGFHVYIDDTRHFSADRFCERVASGMVDNAALANPYKIGAVALTWIGAELNRYRTAKPSEALSLLDPQLRSWLEGWRTDMAAVETCVDARDLAVRIVEELDRLRENQPEEDGDGQAGDGQARQSQTSTGQSQAGSASSKPSNGGAPGNSPTQDAASSAPETKEAAAGEQTGDPTSDGISNDDDDNEAGDQEDDGGDTTSSAQSDAASSDGNPGNGKAGDSGGDNAEDDGSSGGAPSSEAHSGSGEPAEGDDPQAGAGDDGDDGDDEVDDAKQASAGSGGDDEGDVSEDEGASDQQTDDSAETDRRPTLKVEPGSEEAEAEAADLEIDDLSRAIRSIKGPEAVDPHVEEGGDIVTRGRGSSGGKAEEIVQQAVERGQQAYAAMRQEIAGAAARSAGILRRMLMSQTRRTWRGGKEEGDLDFGRIVPMAQGMPDIYKQRVDRTGVNTALSLLLDNSGSMGGHPIRVCQETAIVLDMSIQGTPTKIEITGFTGCATRPVLYRYRSFGQTGQAASASLGNMDQVELGGTPVSTPLLEAWRRLAQQKEPRRIMIVVSDGGADSNDVEASRQAHDFIVSQGCRVIGIAIGCVEQMKQWCDNCQAIDTIEDLPVALTKLVQESMR